MCTMDRTTSLNFLMEQQSRLAIPLNWHNLSQDEDLVAVRWGDCRARVRASYGRKPRPQA